MAVLSGRAGGEEIEGADREESVEPGHKLGVEGGVEAGDGVEGDSSSARKLVGHPVEEAGEFGVNVAEDDAFREVANPQVGEARDEV